MLEVVVPESADGQRIDVYLTQLCDGFSRSQIRQAVQNDGGQVDGRIVRPSFIVRAGQRVCFEVPPPAIDTTIAEDIPLDVLHEDEDFVVVNKPAGMVVHPARGNWTGTLTSALAHRFANLSDVGGPTRPGIIHRLDRDTSGVIVVAKTNLAHMHLSQQFHDRLVQKEYIALTAGRLDRDRDWIHASLGRHPYQRDKQAIREDHASSKPASTFYEVVSRHGRISQVRVSPKTGRTHQIRVHLAHIGCPILCDRLYGGHATLTYAQLDRAAAMSPSPKRAADAQPDCLILDRQALHASKLTITHPATGQQMTFTAPLADDMQRVMNALSD